MFVLQYRDDNSKCGPLMIDAAKQICGKDTNEKVEKSTIFKELVAKKRSQSSSKRKQYRYLIMLD